MEKLKQKLSVIISKSGANIRRQRGFSLIEVLVAALILSTGLLGIAGLQIVASKGTQQSLMEQQAMGVVQNMIERMRSNREGVIDGHYTLDTENFDCSQDLPACYGAAADCEAKDIALVDQLNIVCGKYPGGGPNTGGVVSTGADNVPILVDGKLTVQCVAGVCNAGNVQLNIGWTEREFGNENLGTGTEKSISINTRVVSTP